MPGPKNQKKRNAPSQKKNKRKTAQFEALIQPTVSQTPPLDTRHPEEDVDTSLRALSLETAYVGIVGPNDINGAHPSVTTSHLLNPVISPPPEAPTPAVSVPYITGAKLPPPSIEDPGSGPRVRDAQAFLCSPFAMRAADATEAPLCAELAQGEILLMIKELLPEELAIMVWYNRTRRSSRICPVCQRLYTLGDLLPDQLATCEDNGSLGTRARMGDDRPSPQLTREQALSGLCSPICFALAAYNHPNVVHHVWGTSGTRPWRLLASPTRTEEDNGLGLAVRMTRRADLGLGQLLGLQEDCDETDWEDGGWDEWNALSCSPLVSDSEATTELKATS